MLRRRKRKQAPVENDDGEWSTSVDLIDDTMASIQLCLNRNNDAFVALGLPPIVLWHQLYTILPNRTFIDQNVHRLQSNGKLITLKISSGSRDLAILRTEDYIAEVKQYENVFCEQLRQHQASLAVSTKLDAMAAYGRILPFISSYTTVPLNALISIFEKNWGNLCESEARAMVRLIQRLGFLLPTTRLDDEAYSFSVPGIGKLVSSITKTRTSIINILKRTKYKEMHEQQLKKKKLKHSHFQLEFHLADMEGCGLVKRTEVTSGILVALADNCR
ncbi:Serine-threonine protein kinase 19 [Plasmopara halstedii]|uniref:Serine-threonine protein kinase 19 n=1 Tax=Plasmopara halstedii TaxID=4781 RepID=A0A0P1AJL1_PLAHL|nr:Serine-threonine protein kinase 19 [Plasmopara halstedii]CEG41521.1 Serine-threonine protein kinase 19 [Plasmopara halstedii]|eukprot:XP_024577890.1 Serine-threonine protein kinase 19 [Plasmopara halstedii]